MKNLNEVEIIFIILFALFVAYVLSQVWWDGSIFS